MNGLTADHAIEIVRIRNGGGLADVTMTNVDAFESPVEQMIKRESYLWRHALAI